MRIPASTAGAPAAPARMPASARANPSRHPCLPEQRRTWVLDRMDPGNPALNVAARFRLEGRVPGADLDQALARLLARHPALRTSIAEEDGAPVQVVAPFAALHIPDIDLTPLAEADALAQAGQIAQREAQAPFDLSVAPLLRVTRLRLRDNVSILLLTTHRIVCDAAWTGVLAREIAATCDALGQGRTPASP